MFANLSGSAECIINQAAGTRTPQRSQVVLRDAFSAGALSPIKDKRAPAIEEANLHVDSDACKSHPLLYGCY